MQKTCKKCNLEKDINEFSKQKTNKDGYKNTCKKCINEYGREHRSANIESELNRSKKYYEKNKDKRKIYFDTHKETKRLYAKEYRKTNASKIKHKRKEHYESNRDKIIQKVNDYNAKRYANDPVFKLKKNIQRGILKQLKANGYTKKSRTHEILGCSYEEFKQHIESQWESWMTWDNYGLYNGELNYGWDLDHIIPLSSDKTEEGIISLNHYTNLQPLCSYINREVKRNIYSIHQSSMFYLPSFMI